MEDRKPGARSHRVLIWSTVGTVLVALAVVGALTLRNADGSAAKNKKKKNEAAASVAAPVELTEIRRGSISTFVQSTATLEAHNEATLVAKRQGEVVAILVEEGQWVGRGATLARLDDAAARLAVQRAELAAEMARRELDRGQQLKAQGFLSDREIDELDLKRRGTAVELEQARHDLADTRLTAPFAGRVTERRVNLGETVTAGRECFRLVDVTPLLARVYFPERDLASLKVGLPATIELDARTGQTFPAKVALVSPVVDRANGTFKVTLEVRDPGGTLRPGSFARVRIRTGAFTDAVLLPRRALVEEDGDRFVFVAKGDTVARVRVTVGAISGDSAQLLAGLSPGERVVTVGQGGLRPGSRIKPVSF